jgi:hypothetical protein
MEHLINYYPVIAFVIIGALIIFKVRLSQAVKNAQAYNLLFYPPHVVEFRRHRLTQTQNLLTAVIVVIIVTMIMFRFFDLDPVIRRFYSNL